MNAKTCVWTVWALLLCLPLARAQEERTWTDNTGRYRVKATFVKISEDKVYLRRADTGNVISVPLSRLSAADRKLARELATKKSQADRSESASPSAAASSQSAGNLLKAIKTSARLEWSKFPMFGPDGKESRDLELVIEATGKPAQEAVRFGKLKLDTLTGSGGVKVTIKENRFGRDDFQNEMVIVRRGDNMFFNNHPKNGIQMRVPLEYEKGLKSIEQLKGSFHLITGADVQRIVIPDVSSLVGKKVDHERLKKLGIQVAIKKGRDGQLEVGVAGNPSSIIELRPSDAQGGVLRSVESSFRMSMPNITNYGFSFTNKQLPDNACLLIVVAEGGTDVTIPLDFSNLAVPRSGS